MRARGAFVLRRFCLALILALSAGTAFAEDLRSEIEPAMNLRTGVDSVPNAVAVPASKPEPIDTAGICDLIEANAAMTDMSPDFFARLIFKESAFDAGARSPVGAQGIAQFMPYTAKERGLEDPFDPTQAIRHSALYLRDLKAELGNWGLAAAAYNGGINRVKRWRASGGVLPFETEDYVLSITSRPADWFLEEGREIEESKLDDKLDFRDACRLLPARRMRAPIAIASAPMQPWGVQVAGHPNPTVARMMYKRVQGRFSSVLAGRDPIVLRDRTGRGRIYAVRIGAGSRGEADQLCARLRGVGGSCAVFRN